jgi:hypothetical protein
MTEKLYETKTFFHADRRIRQLLDTLKSKGSCGCCVARAMTFNAVSLSEDVLGSADAAGMLEEIAAAMRERNKPASFPRMPVH